MASIVILSLGGRGDMLPDICHKLDEGSSSVGRDENCTIQVLDPQVSRQHFHVDYDAMGNVYRARDAGSANGTLIDGIRLTKDLVLKDGAFIEVGDSKLRFTMKDFKDRKTAMDHFRRMGERQRGTLMR